MNLTRLDTPDPDPGPVGIRTALLASVCGVTLAACTSGPATIIAPAPGRPADDPVVNAWAWSSPYDTPTWCIGGQLDPPPRDTERSRAADRAAAARILEWLLGTAEMRDTAASTAARDDVFPPLMEDDAIAEAAASWFDASVLLATTRRRGPFGVTADPFATHSTLTAWTSRTAPGRTAFEASGRRVLPAHAARTAPGQDARAALVSDTAILTAVPAVRTFRSILYLSAGLFLVSIMLVPLGCSVSSRRVCPQSRGPPGDESGGGGEGKRREGRRDRETK